MTFRLFKISLLLLGCLAVTFKVQATSYHDSIYAYDDLAIHYRNINSDSSEYFLRKFIQHLDNKDNNNLAYAYTFMGVLKKQQGELDSALSYYQTAIDYQKSIDHREGIAANFNNIGNVYKQKGDYVKAIEHYLISKDLFIETEMEEQLFLVVENLSELYLAMGKIEDAILELEHSNKYFTKANDLAGIGLVQSCMSDVSLAKGDTLAALAHIDSAQNTFRMINYSTKLVIHGIKQCELLLLLDSLQNNIPLLDKYLEKAIELNLTIEHGQLLTLYAKINIKNNNHQESILLLLKANQLLMASGSERYLVDVYHLLANSYEQIGDFPKALKYHKLYSETNNRVQGVEIQKNFQALQMQYQVLEKEKALNESALALLEKENKLQEAKIEIEREAQESRIILIVVIFISVLSIFLYLRFREKQKLSKKLSLSLEERNLLLKEIHHRVKNNLQIINSLLNLQKNRGNNLNPGEIITQTQDRIYSMAVIHEKLYQSDNFANIDIKEYVETLIEHFKISQNFKSKGINLNYEIENFALSLDALIPIGLILNETITNSAKYAFDSDGGNITIEIKQCNDGYILNYQDDGKGLPKDFDISKTKSLGMKLIQGFTKQLNGTLSYKNSNGLKLFFTFSNRTKVN
ncbi:tetratricopeptide repeat-containing sensor histidine kinase [Parvicella tangerina]|uniref:histidine kinase n=1 Tax=Parvicella tangerina TaxID=2829795 RepID=A0A916JJV6_9FLAO|nr:histidine kinase dimerization/phosphoacceptor domain -containing protein [Parvicella tangerina]CAG5077314.1 hypothetical protein CRYO30217_00347 [Parvicella tangerina]